MLAPDSVVVAGSVTDRLPLPEIAPVRPRLFGPLTVSVEPVPRFTALASVVPGVPAASVPPAPLAFSAPLPSAVLLPATSVPPPVRFVPPEYVFEPVSVSVPVPPSVRLPPVPAIVPPYVPLPEPPSVRLLPPRFTVEPATPDSPVVVCGVVAPLTSKVAPAPVRFSGLLPERLPPAPIASVPLLIVVAPVYVFAPVSVSVPVPDSVSPPVPPTVPPNVPLPEPPSVSVLPPRFTVGPIRRTTAASTAASWPR